MRVKIIQEGKVYPQGYISPMTCRVLDDKIPIVNHYMYDQPPKVLGIANDFKRSVDGWLTCEVPDDILPKVFEISAFFTDIQTLNDVRWPTYGRNAVRPVILGMRLRELALITHDYWEEHEDTSSPTQRIF